MLSRWTRHISRQEVPQLLYWGFAGLVLMGLFAAIIAREYLIAGAPAMILILYLSLVDFRLVFFLLLACIPLSTEFYLPNGFGTDLPTEPLMVGLMGVYVLYMLRHGASQPAFFWRHPITLLLLLHFGWIAVTTVTSSDPFISLKFLLAKSWYLVTFYFLAGMLLRTEADLRQLCRFVLIPLAFTILVILARHAPHQFSFAEANKILNPFYRNHVAYASILAVFFPFLWYYYRWQEPGSLHRKVLLGTLLLFLAAIYFSYTRAAYVALLIALGAYFVIRLRLTRYVLVFALVGAIALVAFFSQHNRYLDYAPNYERTITHHRFDNLIEATYQLEDISTMERVYRWIAGGYMSQEKPWFGFGPGNFYGFYRPYTVKSFQTYVSDNPEQSGIHSYYFMLAVEQGFPGLLIFLLLIGYALLKGEALYHRFKDRKRRETVLLATLSLIVILALLIINDLIETDKIGPFFFINLALLVNLDRVAQCGTAWNGNAEQNS